MTTKEKLVDLVDRIEIKNLGLLSISRRPILDHPEADALFLKTLAAYTIMEQNLPLEGMMIRTLEPYLDLKKGLGTKRYILPEKWDDPMPDVPENEPERFLGEDLKSNRWIQFYQEYDLSQPFNGEISVYTTNHFIDDKNADLTTLMDHRKKLDNAPQKCYMITGVQILGDRRPTVDFIKICKKHMKIIDIVSTETIMTQPDKFYEFRTPIIFNPDMDIVFQFIESDFDDIRKTADYIKIHGWVCEPLGKTCMG